MKIPDDNVENHKLPETLPKLLRQLEMQGADKVTCALEVEKYLHNKAWETGIPLYGKFELTPFCNLDCKMCYVHLKKEQMQGADLLSVEQWKHLMRQAVDAGMMVATLTGGECLTSPYFEELYLYLHSMGIQIVVMTNGTLLTEEKIIFLQEHPPKLLQISLYGSNEDGYEQVTGHRCFRQVINAIQLAKAANLPLQIAVTPSQYMADDAESLVRLVASFGMPYNISAGLFEPYEETGRNGKELDMPREDYLKLFKLQARLKGRSLTPGCEEDLPEIDLTAGETKGLRCGGGRCGFTVTWDGGLQPCSAFREIRQYPLEHDFITSWRAIYQAVIEYPRPVECEECRYKPVCIHCVAEHSRHAPIGHASPRICEWGRQLVAEGFAAL